jgi:tetrahydromethanopterin S-methyltransferase subunit A
MPSSKKQFVNRLLGNKAPEYIEENFQYVVEMFEKKSQEEVDEIKESVKNEFVKAPKVDRPQIIEEQKEFNNEIERSTSGEGVSGYLNEMEKLSKFRFAK